MSMGLTMGLSSFLSCMPGNGSFRRVFQLIVALAAFKVVFSATASAGSAESDSLLEWRSGGAHQRQLNPSVSKRVAKKLRRKIRKTNLGGIRAERKARRSSISKRKKNSRKARRNTRRKSRRIRVASLGNSFKLAATARKGRQAKKPRSITGGARGVSWVASSGCLNGRLRSAIYHVARTYGRVRVNSTCRSRKRNRRVGGARRSLHLTGNAADIRIWGNVRAAARYLRGIAGGYKHYGGGLFHIDTGPRRSW